jgi:integrase
MHYFRHTVRPLMRRAGFSSPVQDKITGHETRGSIGDVVYDHVMMEELQPAVEAIKYPFLALPELFAAR